MKNLSAQCHTAGGSVISARLLGIEVIHSLESPAVSIGASFACDKMPDEAAVIKLYGDGKQLFDGMIDSQSVKTYPAGIIMNVEARSKAGVLLDNEALPQSYSFVDADTLFSRYIAPFGFTCENKIGRVNLAVYTVKKGISVWEAFKNFVERAYRLTPYVQGNKVIITRENPVFSGVISNTGAGMHFTELEYIRSPYEIISEVVIRNQKGIYSVVVQNEADIKKGVQRRRYMAPTAELADTAYTDAHMMINNSKTAAQEVRVTLPELAEVELGQGLTINDNAFKLSGFSVKEFTYRVNAAGSYTDIVLHRY